jgi:hypothetical protein
MSNFLDWFGWAANQNTDQPNIEAKSVATAVMVGKTDAKLSQFKSDPIRRLLSLPSAPKLCCPNMPNCDCVPNDDEILQLLHKLKPGTCIEIWGIDENKWLSAIVKIAWDHRPKGVFVNVSWPGSDALAGQLNLLHAHVFENVRLKK